MNIIEETKELKKVSESVTVEEAMPIIKMLEETLSANKNGIGLSAIQIGIPKRIFILAVKKDEDKEEFVHFINPEVIEKEGLFNFVGEGCLSYPGTYYKTKRYQHYIIKRGLIENGIYREETDYFYFDEIGVSGLVPIAVQHEMDHLDGKVISEYGELYNELKMDKEKVGRNEPCPCGSGKKFKKCCIGN